MNQKIELPVSVLEGPHWRVNFRPELYNDELVKSLGECFKIIEKTKLSLRGWDYPHLGNQETETGQGTNWVASWSSSLVHNEYWRFYQSGQFLHLFSIREALDNGWRDKIKSTMQSRLSYMKEVNWEQIPGFISILNFIYQITEIFEFTARLCEEQIYKGRVNIKIELKGVKGFVLAATSERVWHSYCASHENILSLSKDYKSDIFVASSKEKSLDAIVWFFERFGWYSPPIDVIRHDQENLLKGIF